MAYDVLEVLKELSQEGDPYLGLSESELLTKNWLTKGKTIALYECPKCKEVHQVEISARVPDATIRHHVRLCGCIKGELQTCTYKGTTPRKSGTMLKTTFEKNGRTAMRTTFSDGHSTVRSMTKEKSLKSIENGEALDSSTNKRKEVESVMTKGCREATNKAKQNIVRAKANQMTYEMQKESAERRKK